MNDKTKAALLAFRDAAHALCDAWPTPDSDNTMDPYGHYPFPARSFDDVANDIDGWASGVLDGWAPGVIEASREAAREDDMNECADCGAPTAAELNQAAVDRSRTESGSRRYAVTRRPPILRARVSSIVKIEPWHREAVRAAWTLLVTRGDAP